MRCRMLTHNGAGGICGIPVCCGLRHGPVASRMQSLGAYFVAPQNKAN